jgi:hypothetical protein
MTSRIGFIIAFVGILFSIHLAAQGTIKGKIKSSLTGETLIGASVTYAPGKGSITDLDGNFTLSAIPAGKYVITASYVGFRTLKETVVVTDNKTVNLNLSLESTEMKEVEIIADVARSRETPVAFTTLSAIRIQEESASRDLPMVLNSTPGVYATEQGGGMGDSRVNIRGFDQRNVAVMVDGVPVNDMENGQVFWSNWDGISDITRSMQVQRGLGASKLAIQSVGGTINIITKGIDAKAGMYVKQEGGNNGMLKTSAGYTSGRLKGGWGVTAAGSYKRGNGWTDKTGFEAWSYFIKIQKQLGQHLISLSANGAPQTHDQRTNRVPVAVYDKKLAESLGINVDSALTNSPNLNPSPITFANYSTAAQGPRGARYNPGWGTYMNENGDQVSLNANTNYYHKPQINLSHFWGNNKKLSISNVGYLSIGRGGGTAFNSYSGFTRDSTTGQYDFSKAYTNNSTTIDPAYSSTETKSNSFVRSSVNNHFWYGLLSTVDYKPTANLSILGGIDIRSYKGSHYQTVYDLFGGDYRIDDNNQLLPKPKFAGDPNYSYRMKRKGDKVNYDNAGFVRWAGAFLQAEWKVGVLSFFVNGSLSYSGFKRVDYFRKKDIVLSDTTFRETVGWGDTLSYNGQNYTIDSKESRYNTNDWKWFPGYTLKTGANYNINEFHNVFVNAGILAIAPRYSLYYTNTSNVAFPDAKQQHIYATEIGYGYRMRKHAVNINGYYTYWQNKPPQSFANINYQGDQYSYQLQGLNTLHAGFELDATGYILPKLQYDAMFCWGDWKYLNGGSAYLFDNDGNIADTLSPQAKGVHVGDAAQVQAAFSVRYEPFKRFYFKPRITYFGKNYANLDPLNLLQIYDGAGNVVGDNRNRESWKMPSYYYIELHAGYQFKFAKVNFTLNGSVINLLNQVYITDGINGVNFDASTAQVYVAQGLRFNLGLKAAF